LLYFKASFWFHISAIDQPVITSMVNIDGNYMNVLQIVFSYNSAKIIHFGQHMEHLVSK